MRYILLTLVLLLCFAPTLATDYTLDEDCGLADALRAANADLERGACPAGDGADLITLSADITLTGELPRIISAITIDGAGYTISGDDEFRIFYVDMGGGAYPAKHPSDGGVGPQRGQLHQRLGLDRL